MRGGEEEITFCQNESYPSRANQKERYTQLTGIKNVSIAMSEIPLAELRHD